MARSADPSFEMLVRGEMEKVFRPRIPSPRQLRRRRTRQALSQALAHPPGVTLEVRDIERIIEAAGLQLDTALYDSAYGHNPLTASQGVSAIIDQLTADYPQLTREQWHSNIYDFARRYRRT